MENIMKITVAGVGYVGLSLAVLLAQNLISPIQDEEIERFFREANAGERELNLHTTVDKQAAYSSADVEENVYTRDLFKRD